VSAVFLSLSCTISQTSGSSFTSIQIVDSVGDYGTQSFLALDSKGNPHISYTYSNMANTYLMYASWTGSKFNIQTVDTNGGAKPSIALDSDDNPHICYTYSNLTDAYLMYASWTGSRWDKQTVQFAQNSSGLFDPSLELDASRAIPHIGYVSPAGNLEYASWTGSTWSIETVDPVTEQVADPSLALDSDGKPCLSYFDPAVGLKCARWSGSTWNIMIVDSAKDVGKESSLAIDSYGNPHISYDDDPNGNLKYASWTGSTWDIQIVDRNKHISLHSSLALDSRGNPHLSYEDSANGNLMYASWTGSMWNLQIVDQIKVAPGDLGVWGFPTSVALDATGTAHISYCGHTRHDLKYASVSDSPSFLVTFNLVGVYDFDGKVLEVDSVDYRLNDLPKSFVWRESSNHSYTFASELNLSSGDKLLWSSTSGLSTAQSAILTVSKEGTVLANYEISTANSDTSTFPLKYVLGSVVAGLVVFAVLVIIVMSKRRLHIP
jgi:hypothetical protein